MLGPCKNKKSMDIPGSSKKSGLFTCIRDVVGVKTSLKMEWGGILM